MKKLLSLIFIAMLVGCAGTDNPTQYSYTSKQYDASTNVTLLPSYEMWISFERIIELHKQMQECLGLAVDPNTDETVIMFRSFEKSNVWFTRDTGGVIPPLGAGFGLFINIGGVRYVFINTDLDKPPYTYQGFDRDAYTDTQVVKHEFIHTINSFNGISGHGDEFNRCDAHITVEN
jgi:hypothetical protein